MINSRFRIAPTPSGFLHKGNVFNFLFTAALAHKNNGKLLLRIDDMDRERYRPEYIAHIFETLAWLGLHWHEGPQDIADFLQHYSQHRRLQQYQQLLNLLQQKQLIYACICSRKDLQLSANGNYTGTCRTKQIPLNTPGAAWRIYVPEDTAINFTDEIMGNVTILPHQVARDFIVRKKDGFPAYQITSLSDDFENNITHIVRGKDLLPSTAAQLFLAHHLNLMTFKNSTFYHHPLLTDEAGNKISKSTNHNKIQPFDFLNNAATIKTEFDLWLQSNGMQYLL